jgi:hypothetical protein
MKSQRYFLPSARIGAGFSSGHRSRGQWMTRGPFACFSPAERRIATEKLQSRRDAVH